MRRCYLCQYNPNEKKSGIALHRFPRDARIRKQWFRNCGLSEEVDDVKNVRICSSHFPSKDVRQPPFGSIKKHPTLSYNAVPSISVPHLIQTEMNSSTPKNFGNIFQSDKISSDVASKKCPIKLVITPSTISSQFNQIQLQPSNNFGKISPSDRVSSDESSKKYPVKFIITPSTSTPQFNQIQSQPLTNVGTIYQSDRIPSDESSKKCPISLVVASSKSTPQFKQILPKPSTNFGKISQSDRVSSNHFLKNPIKLVSAPSKSTPQFKQIQPNPSNFGKISQSDGVPSDNSSKNYPIKLVIVPSTSNPQVNQIQLQLPTNFAKISQADRVSTNESLKYPIKLEPTDSDEVPLLVASPKNSPTLKFQYLPSMSIAHPVQIQTQLPVSKNFEQIPDSKGVSSLNNLQSGKCTLADMEETILPVVPKSTQTNDNDAGIDTLAGMADTIIPILPQSTRTNDEIITCGIHTPADVEETILPIHSQSVETNDNITPLDEPSHCDEKYRRFGHPRYISEITASDLSNPRSVNAVLDVVKRADAKKSKKIRKLQMQKRYLTRRVNVLKKLVKELRTDVKTISEISSQKNIKKKLPVTKNQIKCKIVKIHQ